MEAAATSPVAIYKALLSAIVERRPSGTRQRLATALDTNRSFISQITNPAYPTPIPASHLDRIFEVCHFSPAEKLDFLEAYERAHPRRPVLKDEPPRLTISLPDLGDAARNRRLHELVREFVEQMIVVINPPSAKGKGP